ncbi:MAG: trigger factor [Phycisphaerales bacterium]|nr:MAG: trigger factor [Phycisphaerales bacterium]
MADEKINAERAEPRPANAAQSAGGEQTESPPVQATGEEVAEQPVETAGKEAEAQLAEEAGEQPEEQPVTARNLVTVEDSGPCKKKVVIEIPEQTIREATDKQYEQLRRDAIVPGFRKGRAPRRLLEKRFGKETSEQIKLTMLAEASEAAIKDNDLQTLGEPDIDFEKIELPAEGPMKFDFEVEVRPQFELPELEGIPINKPKLEVTEEQVEREITRMRRWSGVWTPRKEGAAQSEDQIIAEVLIKAEDVEEAEKLDETEIFIRKNGFVGGIAVENLDEILVGAEPGQTKKTTVEVPKTYFKEQYRGKKVDITITVKDIKYLKPADLDENFLKGMNVADENELRENTRDNLQDRLEQASRTEMTEQIYRYLLENTDFELPLDIVGQQAVSILQRQYAALLMRGLPKEQIEEQMAELQAASEERARRQLKTFFIMDKVADKLDIDVTEEEINGHIAQLAAQRGARPERMREDMARDGSLAQFSLEVRQNKCIAKMLESAKITETKPEKKTEKKSKKTAKKAARKTGGDKKGTKKAKPAAKKKTT